MVDPVTALATASSAFSLIKRGFQAGRDIESMASDLGRWMGAMSDLDQAEKDAKNPPIFKKLFAGKSVEQEAIEVFAAKKKATEQRDELRTWIQFTHGQSAWDELLRTEANIRKTRQETIYKQAQMRRRFLEYCTYAFVALLILGFIFFLLYLYRANRLGATPLEHYTIHPNHLLSYFQLFYKTIV